MYKELSNKIFKAGQNLFEDMEVYILKNESTKISIFENQVENYSVSESGGLSLRAMSEGKMGYSYTEKIDETSIDQLIQTSLENAKYIERLEKEEILSPEKDYRQVEKEKSDLKETSYEDKVDLLLDMEKKAFALDSRVSKVEISYGEYYEDRYIINTKGMDLSDSSTFAYVYVSIIVKDGEEVKTGGEVETFKKLGDVDRDKIVKSAVDNAITMLGAKSTESGEYRMLMENATFIDFFSAFTSNFSADNVEKGLSSLKGKVGSKIASDKFTLIDDAYLKEGEIRAFDDEGTATENFTIIENGLLKTFLYDSKSAKLQGKKSTGNGRRGSYKGSISIMPNNLVVEAGNLTRNQLLEKCGNGIYINSLQGLHSGIKVVSGDFSLSASGYLIEGGKITRPLELITIAGNFYELLENIEEVGSDIRYMNQGGGAFGSPSILVKSIALAGSKE